MNIYVYMYDGFAEFEVVFVSTFTAQKNVVMVAQENRAYRGEGKFNCLPDKTLADIDPSQVDIFIIPGGDYKIARKDIDLGPLLKKLNDQKKLIAGICGGCHIMADNDLLFGHRCTGSGQGLCNESEEILSLYQGAEIVDEGLVNDGHLITATGQSYLEFGCAIEMRLGLTTKEQMREDYKFWKNHNSTWEKKLYCQQLIGKNSQRKFPTFFCW